MVNGKKFAYTPKGKKAAKAYAAGEKMESKSEKMMEMKKGMKKKVAKKKPAKRAAKRGLFGGK
jgi:hypothetical protein